MTEENSKEERGVKYGTRPGTGQLAVHLAVLGAPERLSWPNPLALGRTLRLEGLVGKGGKKKFVGTVWSCKVYVSKPESILGFRSP